MSDGYEIRLIKNGSRHNKVWEGTANAQGITIKHGIDGRKLWTRNIPIVLIPDGDSIRELENLARLQQQFGFQLSWKGMIPLKGSVQSESKVNEQAETPFMRLVEISSLKTNQRLKIAIARIAVHKLVRNKLKEHVVMVKPGDALSALTQLKDYEGYKVDEINPAGGYVLFGNGKELKIEESQAVAKEEPVPKKLKWGLEPPEWFF